MNTNGDNDFEYIEAYFNLEFTEKENSVFEERLKEDLSFANKVDSYAKSLKLVDSINLNSEENNRKMQWKEILNDVEKNKSVRKLYWFFGIAASLLVLIGLNNYLFLSQPDYDSLVQQAWSKNVGLDFILRGTGADQTELDLNRALDLYKKKDFNRALNLLTPYESTSKKYNDILLLKALTFYRLHKEDIALKTLDTLQLTSVHIAKWYKGLIYLEKSDIKSAERFLHISTSNIEIKE
ncbi:hypothetical protein [Tenacibaculum xiamenense]|uniref:hypothetical protein n=1 Tax=Tenacibaculum xiamenense TaxID=1261553 RepID=UPI00389629D7